MSPEERSRLDTRIQAALVERAALRCAARGDRRIAVYGAGRHTVRHGLAPFSAGGLEVVAVLDDRASGEIDGVAVRAPSEFHEPIDAIVVSSDSSEEALLGAASAWVETRSGRPIPVERVYGLPAAPTERRRAPIPEDERRRLRDGFTGRLNLGCGDAPLVGWTNIDGGDGEWYAPPGGADVIRLDVFEALTHIEDGSCEAVYSEHFFEHFTIDDGHQLITEWARVLRPGGVVRVVTPDLRREAELLLRQTQPASDEVIEAHRLRWLGGRWRLRQGESLTRAMVLNACMRLDGHRFVYDYETLAQSLALGGFGQIEQARFAQSRHAVLDGLDRHDGGETGREWVPGMVLAVDAVLAG